MIEVTEVTHTNLDDISENVQEWDTSLDPSVRMAYEALTRQNKKPSKILELDPTVPNGKEGIYYLPGYENFEIVKVGQSRNTADKFTRGTSAHNVAFALAQIRTGNETRIINVAVKPFLKEDTPQEDQDANQGDEKARKEAVINGIILERGFKTTSPICVILDRGDGFIITPVRKGVQSLDTDLWAQFIGGPEEVRNHFIDRLRRVAVVDANLNAHGINHADGALRNFWSTPAGEIEAFDWESASVTTNPPAPDKLVQISVSTLRPLYRSIAKADDPKDTNPTVAILRGPKINRWHDFNTLVFSHYVTRLMEEIDTNESLNDEYLDAIASIEDALREKIGV